MRQILIIVDVQSTFSPPEWLVSGVTALARHVPAVATIELLGLTKILSGSFGHDGGKQFRR